MLIAIMQPTFMPWIGYFAMIDQADRFVLLDSVQFAKRSWQQRNRVKSPTGAQWITVPVLSKGLREQLICETQIDLTAQFPKKSIRTLETYYRKAPFYADYHQEIFALLEKESKNLGSLNFEFISLFLKYFGIDQGKLVKSSQLEHKGSKADLLVDICKQLNASEYLSAPGSKEYIDQSTAFEDAKIGLKYHEYQHPEYQQLYGPFISHLSAIDLIFNEGPNSLEVLRKGIQKK